MAADESPGLLHGRLVARGPELLVIVGLVLVGLGVGLDRDWLVGFGVVTLMLGVVLPRVRGALEAGPGGLKVAEIIDPTELRSLVQTKGKDLPTQAIERATDQIDRRVFISHSFEDAARVAEYRYWLRNALAEGILTETARKEWRVTFVGPLSDEARRALDSADDVILVSGHTVAGVESHSVIANAATATEAVNRVRAVLEGTGTYHRWDVNEFVGGGFFGPREEPDEHDADDSEDD